MPFPTELIAPSLLVLSLIVVFAAFRVIGGAVVAGAITATAALAFVVMHQPGVPPGFAITGAALVLVRRQRLRPFAFRQQDLAIQLGVLLSGLSAYTGVRYLIQSDFAHAHANALRIIDFERGAGLLQERHVQTAIMRDQLVMRSFNGVYAVGFLATVASVLLWLFFTDRPNYGMMRNCLGISALLGLATISVFPVAPPRMMPQAGVIDTILAMGREQKFANEYGAMPSLHVGWMVLSGAMLWRSIGGRRGLLIGAIPGGIMAVTVIVTGNHYILDCLVGTAFCLVPAAALCSHARSTALSTERTRARHVLAREGAERWEDAPL